MSKRKLDNNLCARLASAAKCQRLDSWIHGKTVSSDISVHPIVPAAESVKSFPNVSNVPEADEIPLVENYLTAASSDRKSLAGVKFPKRSINGKERSFASHWYERYDWMEYNIEKDAVFCKPCYYFSHRERDRQQSFCGGFSNWNKLGEKAANHANAASHQDAASRWLAHKQTKTVTGTIKDQIEGVGLEGRMLLKHEEHLHIIIDLLLTLAKQDLPLRGHREHDEGNKGNFLEFYKLLKDHSTEVRNAYNVLPNSIKMMSPEIQNRLLEAATMALVENIRDEIGDSYYAILADECKDSAGDDLVAVCIRYLNKDVRERAIGFVNASSDQSASGIAKCICTLVDPLGLDSKKCVGFGFDGASVMSGKKGGVQAKLKEYFPNAVYVHCHSHRLNLVLCSVVTNIPDVRAFFNVVNALVTFFQVSQRKAALLEAQKIARPGQQPVGLPRSSNTRWSSHAASVDRTLMLFPTILETLEHLTSQANSQMDAHALLTQMRTKKFVFMLVAMGRLFEVAHPCTIALQQRSLCLLTTIDLVKVLQEMIESLKTMETFNKLRTLCLNLEEASEITDMDVRSSRVRLRKPPVHLADYDLDNNSSSSKDATTCITTEDDMLTMWIRIIECVSTELSARFTEDAFDFMTAATAVSPSNCGNIALPPRLLEKYDICLAAGEFEMFHAFMKKYNKRRSEPDKPFGLMEIIDACPKEVFCGIYKLLCVLIASPITSVTVERLFSTVKRILSDNRQSMTVSRLNHLSLLSFERDLTDTLSVTRINAIFRNLK